MDNSFVEVIRNQLSEKLNIYFDEDTYTSLSKDMTDFNVVKNNGDINRSEFMNRLIANYAEEYINSIRKLSSAVKTNLSTLNIEDIDSLATKTVMSVLYTDNESRSSKNRTYSFRVNKRQIPVFTEILCMIPHDLDLSSFLRNMALSYLKLPVYRREQIIFLKEYNKLLKAINDKKDISITYKKGKDAKTHIVSPYAIEHSQNELRNYLIVESHKKDKPYIMSLKLYDISDISILYNRDSFFSENFELYYSLMKKNGIAYHINEYSIKKVRMDETALYTYNHKYLERPVMLEYKDGIAYFDCSLSQLNFYFNPFKDSIEIL